MAFNKEKFIEKNNDFLYKKLYRFLDCEIYEEVYKDIIYLISCPNVRDCTYEGNMYAIHKRENNVQILIVDEVCLSIPPPQSQFVVDTSRAQFEIEADDLVELIEQRAKKYNWV